MRTLYVVPTSTLEATKPRGTWHAIQAPGDPAVSLCVVEFWSDDTADDEWEALPGVRPLHIWEWGQTVPPIAVTAFGPWGVLPTDLIWQAMKKVKLAWSHARP